MKKRILLIFVLILSLNTYAQIPEQFPLDKMATVKTPDVSSLESVSFTPVNEYTGRIQVSIPIYTINFEGISIPISISYNSGGVKVNSPASSVGLNWSLNAGGIISHEVKGDDDFEAKNDYSDGCLVYTRAGYLNRIVNNIPIASIEPSRLDRQPDVFLVSAPGFSTQFTHNSNGSPFELTSTGAHIENYFNDPTSRFEKMKVTSAEGMEYTFSEREYTWYGILTYNQNDGPHNAITLAAWDSNTSINDANNVIGLWSSSKSVNNPFSSLHLSSIHSPVSGQSVNFEYIDNYLLDYNRRIERNYNINGSFLSQTDFVHDFTLEKIISKITFPDGVINFYYSNDRSDLVGAKRLTSIEIKDNNNQIIKKIIFSQDYFSSSNCTGPQCLRLKLNEVYFEDKNNNVLPGYKFIYNSTELPPRFSYKQDFLGYANGALSSSTTAFIPKIYKKENQGRDSFIPFNLTSLGYQALSGTYSLESNLTYAKAGSLEEIIYPTGGYSIFDYELNRFKYLNTEIQGGGLRIVSNKLYDKTELKRQINYSYLKSDGSSSGSILFVPRYVNVTNTTPLSINQKTLNPYELTNNSYVGYSRAKIQEAGNGYKVNEYTSPESQPNIYPTSYININTNSYTDFSLFNYAYANGLNLSLNQNMEIKRGQLLTSKVYNQSNALLEQITNEYEYKTFGEIGIGQAFNIGFLDYLCDLLYEPYALFTSKIVSERNLLTKSTDLKYLTNGNISEETSFVYDLNKPFIKEKSKIVNSKTLKEKYYYAYETEFAGNSTIDSLISQNRISEPIRSEKYNDVTKLITESTSYKDWGANSTNSGDVILPEKIQAFKGENAINDKMIYLSYDSKGNPTEVSKKDGIHIVYIWGYQQSLLIAKIENATYSQVASQVTNLQTISNISGNQNNLLAALSSLRNSLPNAMVTTYTYIPLIGVSTITDPKGLTTYYEYDSFNRLKFIKDQDLNVLSRYCYNYKGQTIDCSDIGQPILSAPTGLTLTSATSSSLNFSWNAITGATGYKIYKNGIYVNSTTTASGSISGLSSSTTYNIQILAYNGAGDGALCSSVSMTTSGSLSFAGSIMNNTGHTISAGTMQIIANGSMKCSIAMPSLANGATFQFSTTYTSPITSNGTFVLSLYSPTVGITGSNYFYMMNGSTSPNGYFSFQGWGWQASVTSSGPQYGLSLIIH